MKAIALLLFLVLFIVTGMVENKTEEGGENSKDSVGSQPGQ